jgi:hypothetical protein
MLSGLLANVLSALKNIDQDVLRKSVHLDFSFARAQTVTYGEESAQRAWSQCLLLHALDDRCRQKVDASVLDERVNAPN